MDSAQAAQMIAWLDEEQRKDKALIAELRDLIQKQAIELGDQRKRIEELQGRVTRLQGDLSRMSQMDQIVQQVKAELAAVLHDVREELRRNDQQTLQARQLEREADAKAVLELGQRVEKLATLADRLTQQGAEQQRLNEALTAVRQRLDQVDRESTRRADLDRLAEEEHKREITRIDALQQGIDAIRAQIESYLARLQYLERWAQGSAQRTAEWQAFRADMQRLQGELQEAQRRSDQRVEKQIREWATISEGLTREQDVWANQLRMFAEQHERTKKTLATLQDLAKELRVAQEEARQAVDLAGEKQRRELREWQGENEKRWTRYLAQWEFRWSEQKKADEALAKQLDEVMAAHPPLQQAIQQLRAQVAEEAAAARAAMLELWRFQLESTQRQVEAIKPMADRLRARLGE